jgi:pilus assembly protein CpaC
MMARNLATRAESGTRKGAAAYFWLAVSAALCLLAGNASAGAGVAPMPSPTRDQRTIVLPLNKSRIIDLRSPIARVSVANPAIADILVVNPRQVYVVGKELGTTNMVLWADGDRVQGVMGLEVTHDLQGLKEKMHHYLPGERIRIESAQGAIVLSGEVSSTKKMDAALRLAKSYASAGAGDRGQPASEDNKVLNFLQVGGAQQVLLEVKVAEIARTLVRRLDINFASLYNGGTIKIGTVGSGASFPDAQIRVPGLGDVRVPIFSDGRMWGPPVPEIQPNLPTVQDKAVFLNSVSGNFLFNAIIDAGKNQGLAKVLAEPNLTTMSGQEAKFLAGGEFPIPVPQGNAQVTVEFKEYGVGLVFVPVVLDSGLVSLKVNVSVSELSSANALNYTPIGSSGTYVIPSLTKRSANASVEVPSGRTIAIAGLINENLRENVDKFPGLGSIPIIGQLFTSQNFQKGQTELVIFVTPRLARPFRTDLVKLPTDDFVEPNDTEFYLLGRLQGHKPGGASPAAGTGTLGPDKSGAEGYFGHDL